MQAAATGEAFMDAARSVGSLLTRHSLSAVTVWWMPNFVAGSLLSGIMMIAALAAYNIATAMWKDTHRHDPQQVRPPSPPQQAPHPGLLSHT